LNDNPNISGSGVNEFSAGFSEENLDSHWEKHFGEYTGYTKEQYAQEALSLIQSGTDGTVLGYKNELGQIVRYDFSNNNFVKGHPKIGIATMYKPKEGIDYFFGEAAKEARE